MVAKNNSQCNVGKFCENLKWKKCASYILENELKTWINVLKIDNNQEVKRKINEFMTQINT